MELNIRGQEVDIDSNCVPLVKYFNDINLDTKYCCEGHKTNEKFYIMFEDYISDEQIINFITKYSNIYNHIPFVGMFVKWVRKCNGDIIYNWMYITDDKCHATTDYNKMTSNLFAI